VAAAQLGGAFTSFVDDDAAVLLAVESFSDIQSLTAQKRACAIDQCRHFEQRMPQTSTTLPKVKLSNNIVNVQRQKV